MKEPPAGGRFQRLDRYLPRPCTSEKLAPASRRFRQAPCVRRSGVRRTQLISRPVLAFCPIEPEVGVALCRYFGMMGKTQIVPPAGHFERVSDDAVIPNGLVIDAYLIG